MGPSTSCKYVMDRAIRNARAARVAAPGLSAAEIEVIVSVPLLDSARLRARAAWESSNPPGSGGITMLGGAMYPTKPRTPGRYA